MSRIFRLLLAVCLFWSQATALFCPSAPGTETAGNAAAHVHAAAADHAAHDGAPHPAPKHSGHHQGSDCKMVMACGMMAVPAISERALLAGGLSIDSFPSPVRALVSAIPATDPPPPRLLA